MEYEPLENIGHRYSKLSLYDKETVKILTDWAKQDLVEFKYPIWDGVNMTSYLQDISYVNDNN
jgi:hypothetical protein